MTTAPSPPPRYGAMARQWRSHLAHESLHLPVCPACGQVCYPLRELCANCWSSQLVWQEIDNVGEVLARCTLAHSNAPYFRGRLPLRIGSVKLACGPVVIAFLSAGVTPGQTVRVLPRLDEGGEVTLVATQRVPSPPA